MEGGAGGFLGRGESVVEQQSMRHRRRPQAHTRPATARSLLQLWAPRTTATEGFRSIVNQKISYGANKKAKI
jgi:hypothetical protein